MRKRITTPMTPIEHETRRLIREILRDALKRAGAFEGIPKDAPDRILAAMRARGHAYSDEDAMIQDFLERVRGAAKILVEAQLVVQMRKKADFDL